MVLLEVPHHLFVLVLPDLAPRISLTENRVRRVALSIRVRVVPRPPAPRAPRPPSKAPEDEENEEQAKEPSEAERERIEPDRCTGGPEREEDRRDRDSHSDQDEERDDSECHPTSRAVPFRFVHHGFPPSTSVNNRSATRRIPSRCA